MGKLGHQEAKRFASGCTASGWQGKGEEPAWMGPMGLPSAVELLMSNPWNCSTNITQNFRPLPRMPKIKTRSVLAGPLTSASGFSPVHPLVMETTLCFLNSCSLKCDHWTNNVPITWGFIRNSGLHSDLLKQKLCFNRIPGWFTWTWEAERQWLKTKKITPTRSPSDLAASETREESWRESSQEMQSFA